MKNLRSFCMLIMCLSISSAALAGGHSSAVTSGQDVFTTNCESCHSGGIGGFFSGAPDVDDESDWEALRPKGIDGLTATTIAGIGDMAARGGCATCTDDEIRAAIEYMLEQIE
jgi:cytochrome c5